MISFTRFKVQGPNNHTKQQKLGDDYMLVHANTGSSCTFFRLRKALTESQALVTGATKGRDYKNWPLTLTMVFKLLLSLADLVTDILFAFFDKNITNVVSYLAKFVLILQVIVQWVVIYASVKKIKKQLGYNNNDTTWFGHYKSFQSKYHVCCRPLFFILYPFIRLVFILIMSVLVLVLGLTKLLAIKQIQQWWLGLLLYKYNEKMITKEPKHKKQQNIHNSKAQKDDGTMLEIFDAFGESPDIMTRSVSVISAARSRVASIESLEMNMRNVGPVLQMYDVASLSHEQEHKYEMKAPFSIGSASNITARSETLTPNFNDHDTSNIGNDNSNDIVNNFNSEDKIGDVNDYLDIQMAYIQLFKQLRHEQKQIQQDLGIENKSTQGETDGSRQGLRCECCVNIKNYYFKSRNKKITNRLGWTINNVKNMPLRRRIILFIDLFTPKWMEKLEINCTIYNNCMMSEIIIETIPQLVCM